MKRNDTTRRRPARPHSISGTLAAVPIIVAAALCPSCSLILEDYKPYGLDPETEEEKSGSLTDGKGTYVLAVEFPQDYDFRKNPSYGNTDGRIVLYKDRKEIFSMNAGPAYRVSTEADLHHLIDGHIYTEYYDGKETHLGCDGSIFLSVDGHEIIKGMKSDNNRNLYILSQKESPSGLILRRMAENAESAPAEIIKKDNATVLGDFSDPSYGRSGALYEDKGKICFVFRTGEEGSKEWHLVKDGSESKLPIPEEADRVFDVKYLNGECCSVLKLKDGSAPVIEKGSRLYDLSKSLQKRTEAADDYRIFNSEKELMICGSYAIRNSTEKYTGIWNVGGLIKYLPGDCMVYRGGDYVVKKDGEVKSLISSGKEREIGDGYRIMSASCVDWGAGGPVVALSSKNKDKENCIVYGSDTRVMKLNGYLSSVTILEK